MTNKSKGNGGSRNAALSEAAYQKIRTRIFRGEYALGAVLSRRKLAREFGMSFLPVSEALLRLEAEGLVESRPRAGTRVRVPTEMDVRGMYVVREALEAQAARLFVQKADAQDRQEILQLAGELDQAQVQLPRMRRNKDFIYDTQRRHFAFHLRIAEFTRFPALVEAIEKSQVLIFDWPHETASNEKGVPAGIHRSLAFTLCNDDEASAAAAMREHIRQGLPRVLEALRRYDFQEAWRLRRSA